MRDEHIWSPDENLCAIDVTDPNFSGRNYESYDAS